MVALVGGNVQHVLVGLILHGAHGIGLTDTEHEILRILRGAVAILLRELQFIGLGGHHLRERQLRSCPCLCLHGLVVTDIPQFHGHAVKEACGILAAAHHGHEAHGNGAAHIARRAGDEHVVRAVVAEDGGVARLDHVGLDGGALMENGLRALRVDVHRGRGGHVVVEADGHEAVLLQLIALQRDGLLGGRCGGGAGADAVAQGREVDDLVLLGGEQQREFRQRGQGGELCHQSAGDAALDGCPLGCGEARVVQGVLQCPGRAVVLIAVDACDLRRRGVGGGYGHITIVVVVGGADGRCQGGCYLLLGGADGQFQVGNEVVVATVGGGGGGDAGVNKRLVGELVVGRCLRRYQRCDDLAVEALERGLHEGHRSTEVHRLRLFSRCDAV